MSKYFVESQVDTFYDHGMGLNLQRVPANSIATKDHIHELIEFLYVRKGSYTAFVNDTEYTIGKGDVLLIRSNAVHRVYSKEEPENEYYVLKFKLSFIFDLALEENAAQYVLRFALDKTGAKTYWAAADPSGRAIRAAFDRLAEEYTRDSRCKDISLKLCASSVVLETLRSILEDEEKSSEPSPSGANRNLTEQIYRTIKYVNRHYAEDIDAQACADRANMSYSYFSRSFKRITGKSFKEYLNFVRVNHAEQLIYASDKDITEISIECGYNSVSYFISVYKQLKGKTPLRIRKEGESGREQENT